jgi:hypothetical protein
MSNSGDNSNSFGALVSVLKKRAEEPEPPQLKKLGGVRLKSQEPNIIETVEQAMATFPKRQDDAARSIHMHKDNFSFIRKLILIGRDPLLSREDREKLNECFRVLERERRIVDITEAGRDLIERRWIKRKESPYVLSHRRKRFDQTIMAIRESCESTSDMMLPRDLERENIADAISSLATSVELISKLMRKLVGGTEA